MVGCCGDNRVEPEEEEEDLVGPLDNRSCTDVIFLILFLAYVVGMIVLFGFGVSTGDPNRIISGYDVQGDTCGQSNQDIEGVTGSGKNLEKQGLLHIDLVRTALILGDDVLKKFLERVNVSFPEYKEDSSQSHADYCIHGRQASTSTSTTVPPATTTAASRRKRELQHRTRDPIFFGSLQNVRIGRKQIDEDTEVIAVLQPHGQIRIWRTSKATSETVESHVTGYDPISTFVTGGGACRYCLSKCPDGYKRFLSRCLPEFLQNSAGPLLSGSGAKGVVEEIIGDIQESGTEILIMSIVAVVGAFLMTLAFRMFSQIIVYLIIGMVVVGLVAGCIVLWTLWFLKNKDLNADSSQEDSAQFNSTQQIAKNIFGDASEASSKEEVTFYLIGAIVMTVLLVVILLLLLVLWKRIKLVIQLFREAGAAVHAMPLMILLPVLTVLLQVIVVTFWIYGTLWIESSGVPVKNDETGFVTYTKTTTMLGMRWYHIFGLLWLTQFLVAAQHMVVAGSVAGWYFSKDKSTVGASTILGALYRLVRYHLGTIAFGSFIIALIQLIRLIVRYLESRAKSWERNGCTGPMVKVLKLFLKCIQCCLWCFEKWMKYISVNAYIETAIYGYNFCRAAVKAFQLLTSNALRVAAINSIGAFVLFLGKFAVVIITVLLGVHLMKIKTGEGGEYIEHSWAPVLLGGFFAYVTAHSFISIYAMTIDTIFLCFCEDCSRNDGINKPYYMSKGLMQFAENSSKALEELEQRQKSKKYSEQMIVGEKNAEYAPHVD